MKRAAIISIILNDPHNSQRSCNDLISDFSDIVRGRMGIPFDNGKVALISLTVVAELDKINSLTGKLGRLKDTNVKATIAGEDISVE